MTALLAPAKVDQSARMPGGLLAKSLPAPDGWQRGGLVIPFYGCGEPVLRDKCVEGEDVPNRGGVGEFPAIPIEQGVTCSTSGPDSLIDRAQARFTATADWALGRQLQTDAIDAGSTKLDDATVLGSVTEANVVAAVACLEQAASDTGFGSRFVLHSSVRGAAYLASQGLLDVNGNSPTGAPWIISAGYLSHPSDPTKIRFYATGQVWASITSPDVLENVNPRTNDLDAWARGDGVVAFDPCILVAIDVVVGTCPGEG